MGCSMKKLALAFGIFFAVSLAAHPANAAAKSGPQRPANDGCKWEAHDYKKMGLKLWYQNCKDPSAHYVLSWNKNVLEEHRPADDTTYGGPAILELNQKPDNVTAAAAITNMYVSKLTDIERENCSVVPYTTAQETPAGIERYKIVPTIEYEQEVVNAFNQENPDGGVPYDVICGDHGKASEGEAYFEYHPAEATNKFLYVIVGQDTPLFDENSIRLSQ